MLVRVDEHAVVRAEPASELVEPFTQNGVAVVPGVPGQPSRSRLERRLGHEVAMRGRDDGARPGQQCLWVAGHLRLRHGEAHVGEQPTRLPVADVTLRLLVGGRRRRADDVEAELLGEPLQLVGGHMEDCAG